MTVLFGGQIQRLPKCSPVRIISGSVDGGVFWKLKKRVLNIEVVGGIDIVTPECEAKVMSICDAVCVTSDHVF